MKKIKTIIEQLKIFYLRCPKCGALAPAFSFLDYDHDEGAYFHCEKCDYSEDYNIDEAKP